MKRFRIALCMLVLAIPLAVALPSRAATVNLTVSNFRFCSRNSCLPTDFVYVRNPTGNGLLHKNALAATLIFRKVVHPGDTVVWTYRDSLCDAVTGCPGHAVCFENGTVDGDCTGRMLNARSGPVTVSFTVPASTPAKTLIRYFCNVNSHYLFGMTGALLVE
jgi:plastocyanin